MHRRQSHNKPFDPCVKIRLVAKWDGPAHATILFFPSLRYNFCVGLYDNNFLFFIYFRSRDEGNGGREKNEPKSNNFLLCP